MRRWATAGTLLALALLPAAQGILWAQEKSPRDPTSFKRDKELSEKIEIERPKPEYEIRTNPEEGVTKPEGIVVIPEEMPATPPPAKPEKPAGKKDD